MYFNSRGYLLVSVRRRRRRGLDVEHHYVQDIIITDPIRDASSGAIGVHAPRTACRFNRGYSEDRSIPTSHPPDLCQHEARSPYTVTSSSTALLWVVRFAIDRGAHTKIAYN